VFGLFERGNRSFSTILLIAALALVFFSQKGGLNFMRSSESGTGKKDDENTVEEDGATILYSRVLGKAEEMPQKNVIEAVDQEKPETMTKVLFSRTLGKAEKEEKTKVLYSRSLKPIEKLPKKRALETVSEKEPEMKTQVLFSRIVGKAVEEEKPFNVLYSRSVGNKKINK